MAKDIDSLRVLHIGNIAGNAYNIAKALREKTGVAADCYTDHYVYPISLPEWEDAEMDTAPDFSATQTIDWTRVNVHGFKRPAWYFETKSEAQRRIEELPAMRELLRMLGFAQHSEPAKEHITYWKHALNNALQQPYANGTNQHDLADGLLPLGNASFPTATAWQAWLRKYFARMCMPPHTALCNEDFAFENQGWLPELLRQYDIIQTYGVWQLFFPILHTPSIPRITFEHGTMREFPFQDSQWGRKSMLAYKSAFANIITNADAIHNARRMGLNNCVFIPHPVDDAKFNPQPDAVFRSALLQEHDADFLLFAPARHNWALKGNDRMLHAFAQFVHAMGHGPKLLLGGWGQEVERSRELVRQLHIESHVAWLPPLPKRMLARYLNACDVVLDQFVLGAFGTTTPEALACGKPVLLYYNAQDHHWCLPESPPVINVHDAQGIAHALRKLYEDPALAAAVGKQGLEWFRKYHSLDVVVQRHLQLYRKILDAPHCVQVPQQIVEGEMMKSKHISCVLDCRQATPTDAKRWLEGFGGLSALHILDTRLRRMHHHVCCILALRSPLPALEEEARRLGWLIHRPPHALVRMIRQKGFIQLLRTDFVYICTLDQPFIDESQIAAWKILRDKNRILSGESGNINPYIPLRIYSRAFVIYRYLLQKIFRKHFSFLQCQSIMIRYGVSIAPPKLSDDTFKLKLDTIATLAPHLQPFDFTMSEVHKLLPAHQIFEEKMDSAQGTHSINAELNALEKKARAEVLRSFPPHVGLNLTSRCNARCVFCSIQPGEQKVKDAISLDEVKNMDWLRYVEGLSVWGGIGDSLMNRDFLPIVRYLHETFPHLRLDLSTNGIGLNEESCQTLAQCLSAFNVSLNAARPESWEKLMRAKGFDKVCGYIARLAALRAAKGAPGISLSMVLTRDNIDQSVEFVELAHNLGADKVTFVHYVPTTLVGRRDMPAEQSCYLDQDRSDAMLEKAAARAEKLGMAYVGPTLFHKKSEHIHFGARALTPAPACYDPWRTCYLTVDEDGQRQMIFCCSGFYYSIGYDKAKLDETHFRRLWNHPTARFFRHTVNKAGENPICTYCTSVDRFHPESRALYTINEKMQPYFSEIDRRYRAGEDVDVTEISSHIKLLLA